MIASVPRHSVTCKARLAAVAVAIGLLGAVVGAPADATPSEVLRLNSAKQQNGKFKTAAHANLAPGAARNLYLKAKNTEDTDLEPELRDFSFTTEGYTVKYFRNDENITAGVDTDDGYTFTLRGGKSKVFRVRVKRADDEPEPGCVRAQIVDSNVVHDVALATLNHESACDA